MAKESESGREAGEKKKKFVYMDASEEAAEYPWRNFSGAVGVVCVGEER